MNETKSVKKRFTAKNVLRGLSILSIVFVFCPSFLVSCSGQKVNISPMSVVTGISMYGSTVVEPNPIMVLCLLIPIIIIILLSLKKFTERKTAVVIAGCGVVDFIIYLIFRSLVKKFAEDNLCSFKTTGWYGLSILTLILIMVIAVLILLEKIELETDLVSFVKGEDNREKVLKSINKLTSTVSNLTDTLNKKPTETGIGFCNKCGSVIEYGNSFCTSCGTPVPESLIQEAEMKKKEAEEKRILEEEKRESSENNSEKSMFCNECGAKLEQNSKFCISCGARVE